MKKIKSFLLTLLVVFFPTAKALAVCPVCTVAVIAGLGLSRWIGIDDTISGIWIGGLLVSISIWTINWLKTKKLTAWYWQILSFLIYYGMVVWPLYHYEIVGHPLNVLWGMDKLITGIIFGSISFFSGVILYEYLKKKNGGHAHFPFEKVAMPISPLIILSIIFYFLTK